MKMSRWWMFGALCVALVGCDGEQQTPQPGAEERDLAGSSDLGMSSDLTTSSPDQSAPPPDLGAPDAAQADDGGAADMRADQGMMTPADMQPDAGDPADMAQDMPSSAPTCRGYATRYWDCCKAHCGWAANVPSGVAPVTSCAANDAPQTNADAPSACGNTAPSSAFTCNSMAPWAVSATLSYGFAAVPAQGDICGRCYEISFDGTSYNAGNDPGSAALAGKRMIVQATNIGHDVGNGQFDLLIPGGGVGIFDACTYQWGVQTSELGATYGGFLTHCKQTLGGGASHAALKTCLQDRCDAVFDEPHMSDLAAGCSWFASWFELADNPALNYREIACPQAIIDASGVDRRPLNDVAACDGGGSSGATCTPEIKAQCDCAWANGGASCGANDGSCCWSACCGS
jgi:hypothetical protein